MLPTGKTPPPTEGIGHDVGLMIDVLGDEARLDIVGACDAPAVKEPEKKEPEKKESEKQDKPAEKKDESSSPKP